MAVMLMLMMAALVVMVMMPMVIPHNHELNHHLYP
jgi:hypothetical protein